MPAELHSLAESAREFLAKFGYVFVRLESANFDAANDKWNLVFDVGVAKPVLKKVIIDGTTGKVVGFE